MQQQQQLVHGYWATNHLASDSGILNSVPSKSNIKSFLIGNVSTIPITYTKHTYKPSCHRPLHLHNVLVTLHILNNLICVRKFTRDNKFFAADDIAFSMKDFRTQ